MAQAKPSMAEASVWVELVKLLPALLWFGLAVFMVHETYHPLLDIIKKGALRKVAVGIVQLEFAEVRLRRVHGLANQGISEPDQKVLLERFDSVAEQLQITSILWVDDKHPQQNASLRPLLASLGVSIDLATSTDDAMKWLDQAKYDIVITNFNRPNDTSTPCYSSPEPANAGCALLKMVRQKLGDESPRLIVYAYHIHPGTPPLADGVANQPAALLHLILDAVARIDKKS